MNKKIMNRVNKRLSSSDITIFTAFYRDRLYDSASILNLNLELTAKINSNFMWLVAVSERNYRGGLHENFLIVSTPPQLSEYPDPIMKKMYTKFGVNEMPSYNHGMKLNHLLLYVKTRYLLFLDPDYFIIPSLNSIIEHMNKKDLSFFGCFYHPLGIAPPFSVMYNISGKFSPVPVVWCCLVDLNQVNIEDFDLLPGYNNTDTTFEETLIPAVQAGSKMMLRFRECKSECVIPCIRKDQEVVMDRCKNILSSDIHYTRTEFQDLGIGASGLAEEYLWRGLPFAVHSRTRNRIKHHRVKKRKKPRKAASREARQEFLSQECKRVIKSVNKSRRYITNYGYPL